MDDYLIAEPPSDDYDPIDYQRIDENLYEQYEDYANDDDYGNFYINQEDGEEQLQEDELQEDDEEQYYGTTKDGLGIIREDSQEDISQVSSQKEYMQRYSSDIISQSDGTSVSGNYDDKSSSSSLSFVPLQQYKPITDFKTSNKKKEMEKKFESIVTQQTKLINDKLFSNKVQQSLKFQLSNLEEQEIEKLIKLEQDKARDIQFAHEMSKKVQKKDYTKKDVESILQEIEFYKKRHHEDQTAIKLLKVEIRKLLIKNDNMQKFDSMSDKSMSQSQLKKIAEVQNTNEELIKENIELKRLLNDKNDELTKNFLKMKKLNLGLQKEYQKEINQLRKTKSTPKPGSNEEKLIIRLKQQDQLITQMRLQLEKFQAKENNTNQKLKEKDEKILQISNQRHERTLKNLEKKNTELQNKINNQEKEISETKNQYAIDNQLKMLFPVHNGMLTRMMNFVMAIEEIEKNKQGPAFKQVTKVMNPLQKFINSRVDRLNKYFELYKIKKEYRKKSKQKVQFQDNLQVEKL